MAGVAPYVGEVVAAVVTSWCISPVVVAVDQGIFQRASGRRDYWASFRESLVQLLVTPKHFFMRKTFWWSWTVYASTFVASNVSERVALTVGSTHTSRVQLAAVCAVNIPLSALRDRHLLREYGLAPRKAPLGTLTTVCFVLRDLITKVGAFGSIEVSSRWLQGFGVPSTLATGSCQLVCPLLAQLINTPIFLFALHSHNYPGASRRQRRDYFVENYWDNLFYARLARVGAAYSVGGQLNRVLRWVLTEPLPKPSTNPPQG